MIQFKFELNNVDAGNLLGILQDKVDEAKVKGSEFQLHVTANPNDRTAQANADWYTGHAYYLQTLMEKVGKGIIRS
jgi:hypothetical protein